MHDSVVIDGILGVELSTSYFPIIAGHDGPLSCALNHAPIHQAAQLDRACAVFTVYRGLGSPAEVAEGA